MKIPKINASLRQLATGFGEKGKKRKWFSSE